MWSGAFWAKTFWVGTFWHPVSGVITVVKARFVGYMTNVGKMGVEAEKLK